MSVPGDGRRGPATPGPWSSPAPASGLPEARPGGLFDDHDDDGPFAPVEPSVPVPAAAWPAVERPAGARPAVERPAGARPAVDAPPEAGRFAPAPPRVPVGSDVRPLVSPRPRLRAVRVAIVLAIVAAGARFVVDVVAYVQTSSIAGTDPGGRSAALDALQVSQAAIDRLNAINASANLVGAISFLVIVVAFVFVVRWQNVALRNQRALGVDEPRYRPVSAGWSWVVPIWSFFGPKRAYDDLWRAAAPVDERRPPGGTGRARVPQVFAVWWGTWIAAGVLTGFAVRHADATLDDRLIIHSLETVGALLTVVAGMLFLAVLERITARHEAAAVPAGSAPEAAWDRAAGAGPGRTTGALRDGAVRA